MAASAYPHRFTAPILEFNSGSTVNVSEPVAGELQAIGLLSRPWPGPHHWLGDQDRAEAGDLRGTPRGLDVGQWHQTDVYLDRPTVDLFDQRRQLGHISGG
jgi:hypothetical protein